MGVISQNGIDYPVPSVPVQSDGSATDLIDNAVQTGQTIKSYLNSNFLNFPIRSVGTLSADVINTAKVFLSKPQIAFYHNSNQPSNRPSGCNYGSYLFISSGTYVTIIYCDSSHIACAYAIASDSTTITWHVS